MAHTFFPSGRGASIFHRQPMAGLAALGDVEGAHDDAAVAEALRSPRPIPPTAAVAGPVEAISEDAYERDGRVVLSPSMMQPGAGRPGSGTAGVGREARAQGRGSGAQHFADIRQRAAAVIPSAMQDIAKQIEQGLFGPDPAPVGPAHGPTDASRQALPQRQRSRSLEPLDNRAPDKLTSDRFSVKVLSKSRTSRTGVAHDVASVTSSRRLSFQVQTSLQHIEYPAASNGHAGASQMFEAATLLRSSPDRRNGQPSRGMAGRSSSVSRLSASRPSSAIARPKTSSRSGSVPPPARQRQPNNAAPPAQPREAAQARVPPAQGKPARVASSRPAIHKRGTAVKTRDADGSSADILRKVERLRHLLGAGQASLRSSTSELRTVEDELDSVQQRSGYLEHLIRLLAVQLQSRQRAPAASASTSSSPAPQQEQEAPAAASDETASRLETEIGQLLELLSAPPTVSASLGRLTHALSNKSTTAVPATFAQPKFTQVLDEDGELQRSQNLEAKKAAAMLHAALPPTPSKRLSSSAPTSAHPLSSEGTGAASTPAPDRRNSVQELVEARMASLQQTVEHSSAQLREVAMSPTMLSTSSALPMAASLGSRNEVLQAKVQAGRISVTLASELGAGGAVVSRATLGASTGAPVPVAGACKPHDAADSMQRPNGLVVTVYPSNGTSRPAGSAILASATQAHASATDTRPIATAVTDEAAFAAQASAMRVCVECERSAATRRCHECGDDFCDACFSELHKKGSRKTHLWTAFSPRRPSVAGVHDAGSRQTQSSISSSDLGPTSTGASPAQQPPTVRALLGGAEPAKTLEASPNKQGRRPPPPPPQSAKVAATNPEAPRKEPAGQSAAPSSQDEPLPLREGRRSSMASVEGPPPPALREVRRASVVSMDSAPPARRGSAASVDGSKAGGAITTMAELHRRLSMSVQTAVLASATTGHSAEASGQSATGTVAATSKAQPQPVHTRFELLEPASGDSARTSASDSVHLEARRRVPDTLVSRPAPASLAVRASPDRELPTLKGSLGVYRRVHESAARAGHRSSTGGDRAGDDADRSAPAPGADLCAAPASATSTHRSSSEPPGNDQPQRLSSSPSRKSLVLSGTDGLLKLDFFAGDDNARNSGDAMERAPRMPDVSSEKRATRSASTGPTVAGAVRGDAPMLAYRDEGDAWRKRQHAASAKFVARYHSANTKPAAPKPGRGRAPATHEDMTVATINRALQPFRYFDGDADDTER